MLVLLMVMLLPLLLLLLPQLMRATTADCAFIRPAAVTAVGDVVATIALTGGVSCYWCCC